MTNNPTLTLLQSRRSPKLTTLTAPGPTAEQLDTLLTLASRVPDHGQLAPWRFIVIAGERRHALGAFIGTVFDEKNPVPPPSAAEATPQEAALTQARVESRKRMSYAPLVIAVVSSAKPHPKIPEWEQVLSSGAACMNLIVAAKAMGFGAVWLSEWYAFEPRVLEHLGLASHERIAGFIHIGTPTETREERPRPALSTIFTTY